MFYQCAQSTHHDELLLKVRQQSMMSIIKKSDEGKARLTNIVSLKTK
jgi:hypothetical protein